MVIETLLSARGEAQTILGRSRDSEGYIDISDDCWSSSLKVLRGLTFDRFQLNDQVVAVEFVDCVFRHCRFSRLRSDRHFWAAENRGTHCSFEDVELQDAVTPSNEFQSCSFKNFHLVGYRPSRTVFADCRFDDLWLEALKVVKGRKDSRRISKVEESGVDLVFSESNFERPRFENCLFAGTMFDNCEVSNPLVKNSDFHGAIAKVPWWDDKPATGNPFHGFLVELLKFIESRFGKDSASHQAIDRYFKDYLSGRVTSRDYSAVLYTGEVPDEELDEIEDALDGIVARYPF